MKQPLKNKKTTKKAKKTIAQKSQRKHPQYGTSKLEEDFAHMFLDNLDLPYEYQFEAKDIGRFYDFYLPTKNVLIEIDGDYWHGNTEIYKEEDLKGFQKRAHRIDELKDRWALLHGIPIIRIWEHDIRKNPQVVYEQLGKHIDIQDKKQQILEDKKKVHINRKLKNKIKKNDS